MYRSKDDFSRLCPFTLFLYYAVLLAASAFTLHPICIAVGVVGECCYAARLSRGRFFRKAPLFVLPGFAAALINVLFNHRGVTVLFRLPGGNSVTLEAVCYGAAAAFALIGLCIGFYCFASVFTTDKLTALFSRAMPVISVMLSMILRFIPLFVRRFKKINETRKALGKGTAAPGLLGKLKELAVIFTILIGSALEGSLITADSMKSRGYGLSGRTSYSKTRPAAADCVICCLSVMLGGVCIFGAACGRLDCVYYPRMILPRADAVFIGLLFSYALLVFIPLIYDAMEGVKWRSRVSKI